jgi:preprotein translocase subunit SecF
MSLLTDFLHGDTHFDFVGRRRTWWRISALAILISVVALVVRDLHLGIEFRGGLSITAANPNAASVEDLRALTSAAAVEEVVIQLINDGASVRIQTPALEPDAQTRLLDQVAAATGTARTEISVDAVGPTFGALILRQSTIALMVFLVAVMLFMTWRLEWRMAAAGIVALVHDLVITAGVYAVTGFEVTPATVVAILTILGYSLYDTVVVFDKVEENVHAYGDRLTISDIVNRSTNLVLSRSIMTALTSLIPVASILFVGAFIFGATSLRDFALALFVGIAVGTYSSIFVATPLLGVWKEREDEWAGRRRRLEAKSREAIARSAPETPPADPEASRPAPGTPRPTPGTPAVPPRRPTASGARPRPPKKRKR